MATILRPLSALLSAAVVGIGGACVVLPAPAAHAETSDAEIVVADGGAALHDGAASMPLVDPASGRMASWVAAAADGTRETLVESVPYDAGDWTGTEDLITVRDAGGRLVRTVDRITLDPFPTFYLQRPVLGSDGRMVAYNLYDSSDGRHFTEVRDVSTGATLQPDVDANNDTEVVGFAGSTLLVVRSRPRFGTESVLQSVAASGSTPPQDVVGAPAGDVSEFRLSPTYDRAALVVDGEVVVAPVTVSGDTVSLGAATTLTSDGHSSSVSWSRDGTSIRYLQADASGSSGDLARVAADGGSIPVVTATPANEQAVAVVGPDPGGPAAPVVVRPHPVAADPTSTTGPRGAFPLTLATTAPAGTTFTVDYQVLPSATWQRLVTDHPGRRITVPAAVARAGRTLRVRVTAADAAGNTSAAVVSGRIVVPFDETAATWCRACGSARRSGAYRGDVHTLSARGQAARLTAVGDRLQVVGERSPRGGRFVVQRRTAGGRWVRLGRIVDTHATSRRARQVLFAHTFPTSLRRTYRLRWLPGPTPARRTVTIDGFGVRR